MNTIHPSRKGFTLIELLTVIAIIGILASILFPVVTIVRTLAHRAASQQNCKSVANAYAIFSAGSPNGKTIFPRGTGGGTGTAGSINDVAYILAGKGHMNNASVWFIPQDPQLQTNDIPQAVILGEISSAKSVSPEFAAAKPKAWAFAVGVPPTADPTTTPLLWTYGLQSSGRWDSASPWEGKGGHIGFLDGHVTWFDQLDTGDAYSRLQTYPSNPNGGQPTADIQDALPRNGRVVIVNEMGKE